LKAALCSAPVLSLPDFTKAPFGSLEWNSILIIII
jgi:hypothetical protein